MSRPQSECEEYRPRERRHRLQRDAYRGRVAVCFTMCLRDGREAFRNGRVVDALRRILEEELLRHSCCALAFCFMPDHLHVLVRGEDEKADALGAILAFKQRSGYWLSRHLPGVRWQKDFYDHIIREGEDLVAVAEYIAANPVRAGLVTSAHEYPFSGSIRPTSQSGGWGHE